MAQPQSPNMPSKNRQEKTFDGNALFISCVRRNIRLVGGECDVQPSHTSELTVYETTVNV